MVSDFWQQIIKYALEFFNKRACSGKGSEQNWPKLLVCQKFWSSNRGFAINLTAMSMIFELIQPKLVLI